MLTPFLTVSFTKPLHSFVLDLNFSLDYDQTLAILGPSGSGKSMTLRMIAGLVKPEKGSIKLEERILLDTTRRINAPPQKRRIGYVFQQYALFPHLTVAANIAYGISSTQSQETRLKKVEQLLTEIHLNEHANRYPSQLSGGQQQRVALARALAAEPDLLLLDEPFSALDEELRSELEALVLRFREVHRVPYILVTHNLEEAYRLCDKLIIIDQGQILQQGDKENMLYSPHTPEVARKLGTKNLWQAQIIEYLPNGMIVSVPNLQQEFYLNRYSQEKKFWLGIRPVDIVLHNGPEPGLDNTFPIQLFHQIRGVRSHTLFAKPATLTDAGSEIIEVEVPSHRLTTNLPYLYFPPEKLITIPFK